MACRRGAQGSRTGRGRFASLRRRALQSADRETDFGVYIHWPFCLSKCPYCDFNSHVRHVAVDEARFARAFAGEIAATAARVPGRTVSTIFFGGGTPSLMQPATVATILHALAPHLTRAPHAALSRARARAPGGGPPPAGCRGSTPRRASGRAAFADFAPPASIGCRSGCRR